MDPRIFISSAIIGATRRLRAWLKTNHARGTALLGQNTTVLATGEIANIRGQPDKIIIGEHCVLAGQLLVFRHGGQIRIGDWVFVGEGSRIWSSSNIRIGSRVLISHNVEIHDTESHPIDPQARAAQTREIFTVGHPAEIKGIRDAPISIGDDVWIGFGATIRKGVTIGDRAIIGAKTIVDRDVPPDTIIRSVATPPR